ncbi:MAG TPA: LysR family transcriptional regulator [Candidatus Methylomirabilis sp.]|nr:LysR family transcriptional regulator [Candidatus Methylomirabilis sp.]
MAKVTIRIDLGARAAVGPGKVRLLELIGESGSISAAGRAMGMSYRRAWTLIAGLNQCFRQPVVETRLGGTRGGGAALTRPGRDLVAHYRSLERDTAKVAAGRLAAIDANLAGRPAPRARGTARSPARGPSPLMPRRRRRAHHAPGPRPRLAPPVKRRS